MSNQSDLTKEGSRSMHLGIVGRCNSAIRLCFLTIAVLLGTKLVAHRATCWNRVRDAAETISTRPSRLRDQIICQRGGDMSYLFRKESISVQENKPGFPSFWNYAPHGPISVSYDERAILLNGTRSLFLGGSMHPVRATPKSWAAALDQAVINGMNLVTIYVFWSAHQPFPDSPYDWSLPGNTGPCTTSRSSVCD